MALTRKFLASKGLEADVIDEIIQAHTDTVEGLKEERDKYRSDAEKYAETKDALDKANEKLKDYSKDDAYKVKYEAVKEEFDEFKKGVEAEKTKSDKSAAYKSLLKEIGISDKRIDAVARLAELDKIKLDKDGKIEGADDLKKSLSEEWADFIVKDGTQGAGTATPPNNNGGGKMTKEQIFAIKDTAARQQAMLENKELFLN